MQQIGNVTNEDIREYRKWVALLANSVISGKPKSVDVQDLMQAGMVGLSEALGRFKPILGVPFKAYATARIVGAMLDELRENDWVPRSTRKAKKEVDKAVLRLQHNLLRMPSDSELAAELSMSLADFQRVDGLWPSPWLSLSDVLPSGEECEFVDELSDFDGRSGSCTWTIDEASEPSTILHKRQIYQRLDEAIASLPEREKTMLTLYFDDGLKLKQIAVLHGVTESRVCQILAKTVKKLKFTMEMVNGSHENADITTNHSPSSFSHAHPMT